MAHIVSHKTGSRIIVHGSTTAKSENLPVLSLTGSEFVMLMLSQKGRLLLRENRLFEAESCRLDPEVLTPEPRALGKRISRKHLT